MSEGGGEQKDDVMDHDKHDEVPNAAWTTSQSVATPADKEMTPSTPSMAR